MSLFGNLIADRKIMQQARKNKEVIYGARALQQQLGQLGILRDTKDYDVYSRKPLSSARQITHTMNRETQTRDYYIKPAIHKGTYRVFDVGIDKKKGTQDDYNLVDYTKKPQRLKTITRRGIKYAHISTIKADRERALRDKLSAYRHKKDEYDMYLIQRRRRR